MSLAGPPREAGMVLGFGRDATGELALVLTARVSHLRHRTGEHLDADGVNGSGP